MRHLDDGTEFASFFCLILSVVVKLASGGVLRTWTSTEDRFRAVLSVPAFMPTIPYVLSYEN